MGLGATSATADASATAVLGLTARLGVGVGRGVSVAATAGFNGTGVAAVEGVGGINATEDLGLEVRLTHGFRPAPHFGLDRVDVYAMLPFGRNTTVDPMIALTSWLDGSRFVSSIGCPYHPTRIWGANQADDRRTRTRSGGTG